MLYSTPQRISPCTSPIVLRMCDVFPYIKRTRSTLRCLIALDDPGKEKVLCTASKGKLSQTGTKRAKSMTSIRSLDELEHQLNPLSVKEAARIYGDSASNFYKKIRRGEVPGVFREKGKPKARIKICPKEFVAWLRRQMAACQAQSDGTGRLSGRQEQDSVPKEPVKREERRIGIT